MYRAFPCADYYHRSATRPFLQSQLTQSSLPSTCRGKTNDRASDVHIAIRVTVDRRLLLYARQAQTQCPRRWLMACTPVARAVWSESKDCFIARRKSDYPTSHTISAILRCVQGEDASTGDSLCSHSQPQARGLVPERSAGRLPRVLRASDGFVLGSPACRISLRAVGAARSLPSSSFLLC
jgi:hypothetical protein